MGKFADALEKLADDAVAESESKTSQWQKDCMQWHRKMLTGNFAHYCPDWDFLPIDDTCKEFKSCTCTKD